jgi:hypothetical protein
MPIHYTIKRKKSIPLELFYKMAAEGLLIDAGQEIHKQSWSTVGRLIERDCFPCGIPATQTQWKGSLSKPARCVQTVASTKQEKLQRNL